jgi:hypothetical protein
MLPMRWRVKESAFHRLSPPTLAIKGLWKLCHFCQLNWIKQWQIPLSTCAFLPQCLLIPLRSSTEFTFRGGISLLCSRCVEISVEIHFPTFPFCMLKHTSMKSFTTSHLQRFYRFFSVFRGIFTSMLSQRKSFWKCWIIQSVDLHGKFLEKMSFWWIWCFKTKEAGGISRGVVFEFMKLLMGFSSRTIIMEW